MEKNQKPEWFELADNDQPDRRPKKSLPKRNLAFIVALVLALPSGVGFALLSNDDESAIALNATQDSQPSVTPAQVQSSLAITAPTSSRDDEDEYEEEGDDDEYRAPVFSNTANTPVKVLTKLAAPSSPAATTATGNSSAAPDLILPPTNKAGDDDEDDDEDDDDGKRSEGKKFKKSEHDDEDDDEDEDDD